MEFVKPTVEWLGLAPSSEVELLKHIEVAGRTCYRSEDKITTDSCVIFLKKILGNGHLSVLEHSNLVFNMEFDSNSRKTSFFSMLKDFLIQYKRIQFFEFADAIRNFTVGGSLRAWVEALYLMEKSGLATYTGLCANIFNCAFRTNYPLISNLLEETYLKEIGSINWHIPCPVVTVVTEEDQLRLLRECFLDFPVFAFRINTDRGLSHEVVRHRSLRPSQESTRWINYKKKLGIQFIYPFTNPTDGLQTQTSLVLTDIEACYMSALESGQSPQYARNILPNCLRTEIVLSGTWGACPVVTEFDMDSGWRHFLRQRLSKAAHPEVQLLAEEIKHYFEGVGLFV